MSSITPFLWFNGKAAAAARFYTDVFKDSTLLYVNEVPGDNGTIAAFELKGRKFMAFDGGPMYEINPAISMMVDCEDQEEVDYFWDRLGEGGKIEACGWLVDQFGVSWQIVPIAMMEMLGSSDQEAAGRAFAAMMKMTKLEISVLQAAFDGVA